ncbi:MAG: hypothetical protein ACP5RR_04295 [Candidatus Kapaibacteriota bacterium]|jgi:hypothetical protein
MFKQIKFFFAFLFVSLLFVSSCSEDNSTSNNPPPANQSYFPTTVGSFWKYYEYEIDSLGVKVPNSDDTVTTQVVANMSIQGKNAAVFVSTQSKSQTIDTSFYAYENNKVYSFLSLFNNEFIPIKDANQWVVVADFNQSDWIILKDTTLANVDLPDVGTMIPTVGIRGREGNTTTLVVKGKSVSAQEFIITFSLKVKLQIPNVPLPINLNFDVIQHTWYAQGIGIVKSRLDPFKVGAVFFEQNFNGNQSELIDYQIK